MEMVGLWVGWGPGWLYLLGAEEVLLVLDWVGPSVGGWGLGVVGGPVRGVWLVGPG